MSHKRGCIVRSVPQGSALNSLLFLVLINFLFSIATVPTVLYLDDTAFLKCPILQYYKQGIEAVLNMNNQWLTISALKANPANTCIIDVCMYVTLC